VTDTRKHHAVMRLPSTPLPPELRAIPVTWAWYGLDLGEINMRGNLSNLIDSCFQKVRAGRSRRAAQTLDA